jgi:diguanylate cyclase (GGDEF)-like protein
VRLTSKSLSTKIAFASCVLSILLSGGAMAAMLAGLGPLTASAWWLFAATVAMLGVSLGVCVAMAVRYVIGAPLEALRQTVEAAAGGDFLIRADATRGDELGALGDGFNRLLAKITDLHVTAIDADRALASAQRELRLTNEVAEKARIIQEQAKQTQARVRELELMLAATEAVSSRLDTGGVMRALAEKASRSLGFTECAILLREAPSGRLAVRATWGFPDAAAIEGMEFEPGEGVSGVVATSGEPLVIEDTARDPRYLHYKGKHLVDGAFACLPIYDPRPGGEEDGGGHRLLGLLQVLRPRADGFREGDLRLLTALARHAALALVNAEMMARLERLSVTDDLTGLANRRLFCARAELELKRVTATGGPLSLVMLAVDGFKAWSEENGHLAGDDLLQRVAAVLGRHVPGTELVARWGGEEFVLLLPDAERRDATARADRLLGIVANEVGSITLSAGVAACPEDGASVALLVAAANRALVATRNGSGPTRVAAL